VLTGSGPVTRTIVACLLITEPALDPAPCALHGGSIPIRCCQASSCATGLSSDTSSQHRKVIHQVKLPSCACICPNPYPPLELRHGTTTVPGDSTRAFVRMLQPCRP